MEMNRTKPNCFIAMRFDAEDTDAIYIRFIEPVVLKLGLNPIQIDKVEHNKNIDEKIISELNLADIVIADLTYARPSVYYEAGYADRKVPVIYTCRSDHLSNQEDSLRVHFDLEHKPIIDWLNIDDNSFPLRLENRINHIVELIAQNTILELENFLLDLKSSLSNPDNILHRIKVFHEVLSEYKRPIDANDSLYEEHIRRRLELFKKYFLTLEKIETAQFHNLVAELFLYVEDEINFLNNQVKKSRYGHVVFLASILKDLYQLYLKISQQLYQRPSSEYGKIFDHITSSIKNLISIMK